jgi:hypothetical protein
MTITWWIFEIFEKCLNRIRNYPEIQIFNNFSLFLKILQVMIIFVHYSLILTYYPKTPFKSSKEPGKYVFQTWKKSNFKMLITWRIRIKSEKFLKISIFWIIRTYQEFYPKSSSCTFWNLIFFEVWKSFYLANWNIFFCRGMSIFETSFEQNVKFFFSKFCWRSKNTLCYISGFSILFELFLAIFLQIGLLKKIIVNNWKSYSKKQNQDVLMHFLFFCSLIKNNCLWWSNMTKCYRVDTSRHEIAFGETTRKWNITTPRDNDETSHR